MSLVTIVKYICHVSTGINLNKFNIMLNLSYIRGIYKKPNNICFVQFLLSLNYSVSHICFSFFESYALYAYVYVLLRNDY